MIVPRHLYKYQPPTPQALENLEQRRLWFSAPVKFNDPLDGEVRIDARDLSDEEMIRIYAGYREQAVDPQADDLLYLRDGKPVQAIKELILAAADALFQQRVRQLKYERGVCCFSERPDVYRMWSHYADGHRGFCLEFDTRYDPFHKVHQVLYSDAPRTFSLEEMIECPERVPFIQMITTKSPVWSEEQEWRIIHAEPDKLYHYRQECLTGVYLGACIADEHVERIRRATSASPTKIYRVRTNSATLDLSVEELS